VGKDRARDVSLARPYGACSLLAGAGRGRCLSRAAAGKEEAFTSGARGLTEADLERAYKSVVDPRLNYEQALELAFSVVHTRRALRE
jgi:hypothetical protein